MLPTYWLFGTQLTILADEQQTNFNYDLIEERFPAGTQTHLHLHAKYNEAVYVLAGAFTVFTETDIVTLSSGEHIFIPQNTPHVLVASSHPVNRILTIASPSGFSKLIRAAGILGTKDNLPPATPTDLGLFIQLAQDSGTVILGSPGARPVLKK